MDSTKSIGQLTASDVSGQKTAHVKDVPADATVGELVQELLSQMKLPQNDGVQYQARLEREGRHLNRSERVGDSLQEDDRILLQPDINAG